MGYDQGKIQLVTAAEAIRGRPAMFVGPLDDPSLFNRLIQESLCIAADEALSGHARGSASRSTETTRSPCATTEGVCR